MAGQIIEAGDCSRHSPRSSRSQRPPRCARQAPPGLAVVLVGDDPPRTSTCRNKRMACEECGFVSVSHEPAHSATQTELLSLIERLNADDAIDASWCRCRCRPHRRAHHHRGDRAAKDVDGFHPYNVGRLALRNPLMRRCTPYGVIRLLEPQGINPKGMHSVVVGPRTSSAGRWRSNCCSPARRSRSAIASQRTCVRTSSRANSGRRGRQARLIPGEWVKPGAVVVDVGINRLPDGKLCGDVQFEKAHERASWITPVPGGVGPMTVAILMKNTLESAQQRSRRCQVCKMCKIRCT